MLKIRLKLLGHKKSPFYSLILINAKKRRNGKSIQNLGNLDRLKKKINLDIFLIKKNIQNGAQFTLPVKKLIINQLLFEKINQI